MNNQKHLRFLTIQVAIATIYVIVTLLFYFMNYDLIQFRISEILLVLVYFNPFNMLGLITGTFIANLFSPHGIIDALIGTLATAISLPLMYLFRKNKFISLSFPVIMNGIIIGLLLHYTQVANFWIGFISVSFGQAVVVYLLGLPFYHYLTKREDLKRLIK